MLETLDSKILNKAATSKVNWEKQLVHISTNEHQKNYSFEFCKGAHFTYKCQKLLAIPLKSRYFELKTANICTNYLRAGHTADKCTGKRCQVCGKRRNTLLHNNNFQMNTSSGDSSSNTNVNDGRQSNHYV